VYVCVPVCVNVYVYVFASEKRFSVRACASYAYVRDSLHECVI